MHFCLLKAEMTIVMLFLTSYRTQDTLAVAVLGHIRFSCLTEALPQLSSPVPEANYLLC